jgi:hypothetical protein
MSKKAEKNREISAESQSVMMEYGESILFFWTT